jgi:hypothetical protein
MPKFIRYNLQDGTTVTSHPVPNARLIRLDGEVFPLFRVDRRGESTTLPEGAEWAESVDQFFERAMRTCAPDDAVSGEIVDA